MNFILTLLQSKLARQIGSFLLLIIGYNAVKNHLKRKGRQEEKQRQKEADYENAADIRRRVDDADVMLDDNDIEYRDEQRDL